jgi:hypothetical protein
MGQPVKPALGLKINDPISTYFNTYMAAPDAALPLLFFLLECPKGKMIRIKKSLIARKLIKEE